MRVNTRGEILGVRGTRGREGKNQLSRNVGE